MHNFKFDPQTWLPFKTSRVTFSIFAAKFVDHQNFLASNEKNSICEKKTFFVSVFRAMSEIFSISFLTSTKLKLTLFGLSSRAWVPGNCAGHHEDGLSLPAFHRNSNKELPFPSPVSQLRLRFRSRVRKTFFRFSCYSGLLRGHLQEVFLWRAAFVSNVSNAFWRDWWNASIIFY